MRIKITQTHNQSYHMLPVHTYMNTQKQHTFHYPASSGTKLTISVLTGVNITPADLPGTLTLGLNKTQYIYTYMMMVHYY